MFVGILDAKLDACNQRMNMLKQDSKGKGIAKSDKIETLTPYMASNLGSHLNFMSQTQLFTPSDNNQVAFYPFQLSQSSQPSTFHGGQSCVQLMEKNAMVDWANQVGVGANCDPKMGVVLKEDGSDKNQNSYYNRNLPSHLQYDATFQTLPDQPRQPPGFELNGFYDSNMLQPHFFNYMHGRN